ncbi:MAG: HAMP domain-containing protein [Gammaproteobacteria bacterium]|nr:HAMP domain-containing protein [Gammaproteobacteria bacterium]MBU1776855.1 HAMP domain-containing protein [Gammaproteobacteria bacterium]MBU1968997.1 HAMP domain-containing protein [Gammaproteobacteria bacterium]
MDSIYFTPFSISVLNVALMLSVLLAFIWRIPDKSYATKQLLRFLIGVDIVFLSFVYIFSSLSLEGARMAWWLLHSVVLFAVFLIQFAYSFPVFILTGEARKALYFSGAASLLTYAFYLYHTTFIPPEFDANGSMFVFPGAYEVGIAMAVWLIWSMAVFYRTARMLRHGIASGAEPDVAATEHRIAAIKKIILILLSPIVLVLVIILAYLELASWELASHLLGTGVMVFLYLFAMVYLNNALEPSSLQIKMVGLFLGAILVVLGFSSAITADLHEEAFLAQKGADATRSTDLLIADRSASLPAEVAYVKRDGRVIYSTIGGMAKPEAAAADWRGDWGFLKNRGNDPQGFYIEKTITADGHSYAVGYSYLLYRASMHALSSSLAWVVLGAALFVVLIFPLFFHRSLFIPLRRLLGGAGQLEHGDLDINLPVSVKDEIGTLTRAFNQMAGSIRESRDKLRSAYEHQIDLTEAYSRFVPKQILSTLNKKSILELGLGDNIQKEMTIMFSDMRSFTSISESLTPEEVFRYINTYLKQVGPIVRKHNGYIDKFIGDAIMALFPADAESAISAAIEMQREVDKLNRKLAQDGQLQIKIGIGIHTGEMMLGTIGESERMEGTVISDVVNVASRIEGLTKIYETPILISYTTRMKLKEPHAFNLRTLDRVRVKGKQQWVDIVEVLDGESGERLGSKLETKQAFEEAVSAFQNQRFEEALQRFTALGSRQEEDRAVAIYRERCEQFIEMGIPENWDGAVKL